MMGRGMLEASRVGDPALLANESGRGEEKLSSLVSLPGDMTGRSARASRAMALMKPGHTMGAGGVGGLGSGCFPPMSDNSHWIECEIFGGDDGLLFCAPSVPPVHSLLGLGEPKGLRSE